MNFQWGEGLRGLLIGAFIGSLAGMGVCTFIIEGTWLFPGDTMLIGAIVCGIGGFLFGESFIEWLKEYWHWFH